ncbi:MAG: ABC transporter ATP-binding protein [Actinomycetota bacterium]
MPGQLSALRTHRGPVAQVVLLGFPAAVAEAVALVVIAGVAVGTVDDAEGIDLPFGIDTDAGSGWLLALAAVLVVIAGALRLAAGRVRARATTDLEVQLRTRMADAYLEADHSTQQRYRAGEFLELSGTAVARAGNGLNSTSEVALSAVNLLVFVGGAILVAPVVGIGIVVLGAVLLGALRPISRRITTAARHHGAAAVEQTSAMAELTVAARDIRLHGAAGAVGRQSATAFRSAGDHRRRSIVLQATAPVVYQTIGLLLIVGALALVSSGDGGDLAAFGGSALLILRSLSYGQRLQTALNTSGEAVVYADQIGASVSHLVASAPISGDAPFPDESGISLLGVSYRYPDATAGETALDAIDLAIGPNEAVGIVGASGSGKSTLADVILRLRAPDTGTMSIGGTEAGAISEEAWRRSVALVPQQPTLMEGTLAENIRYHRAHHTDEEVRSAAGLAGLTEAVADLPHGFDTVLGSSSRDLSGGQLQRVGIARALLGAPRILVLDEPTSALDADSELVIRDAIVALGDSTTIIVIAHRPATLRVCGRLVVIDAGRIVDDGPAAEVAQRSPYVKRLFESDRR